jgi:hypothetical protein
MPAEGAELLEDASGVDAKLLQAIVRIVAPSFIQFLYRYWLENTISMKLYLGIELTNAERAYIEPMDVGGSA